MTKLKKAPYRVGLTKMFFWFGTHCGQTTNFSTDFLFAGY